MKIIRDEAKMASLKKRSQVTTMVGFLVLLLGFVIVFVLPENPNALLYQLLALLIGYGLSQYGAYLSHRYGRSPRPDEVLDDAVRSVARNGRMYHYLLPAPHVLLTKAGPIVFVLKYQGGKISAEGNNWRQKGIGFRRFFGQEGLGNPSKEAESSIAAIANFIREHAPNIEEVPIAAVIVFTSKNMADLDVSDADFPAMHASKVKGFLRKKGLGETLPADVYNSLELTFDEVAAELI